MSEYETELSDVRENRFERERRDCPTCGGVVLEPRSSDKWQCGQCARLFDESEL